MSVPTLLSVLLAALAALTVLRRRTRHVREWADQGCGEDLVEMDQMLAAEMREEADTWMAAGEEEEQYVLKFELSDSIFADLLEETVVAMQTPGSSVV
eukprot:2849747-Pyramimonas_sp.AAC.1